VTEQTPLASALAHTVHAALDAAGVAHDMDWGQETFTLADGVVGVVTQVRPGVSVYVVAEDVVPADALERVALATARVNARLSSTTVEIDMERGLLAVRAAVATADLVLLPEDLGALVAVAADEARTTWGLVRAAFAEVVAGTREPAAAAAELG